MAKENKKKVYFEINYEKVKEICFRYFFMILIIIVFFGLILGINKVNPITAYSVIISNTLLNQYGLSEVIVSMIPMILTSLAVAIPWRVGLINVGGEGQLYIGAAFATWAALTFPNLPKLALLTIMIILGMLGGALWAFIPGYLKSTGVVNETISTLLLNSIAPKLVGFLIFGFWHSPMDTVKTPNFVSAAKLPTLGNTRIHIGFLIGVILLILFWLFMKYTRWGLEMNAISGNQIAAMRNGIPVKQYLIYVMCVGGAIAGFAGMAQVSGYYGVLLLNFSNDVGFMGFLICWLTNGNPLGIFVMSFVVSVIIYGGNLLQLTSSLPAAVVNILLAFSLFIVLAKPKIFRKDSSL